MIEEVNYYHMARRMVPILKVASRDSRHIVHFKIRHAMLHTIDKNRTTVVLILVAAYFRPL